MIKPVIKRCGRLKEPKNTSNENKSLKISDKIFLKEPFLLENVTMWAYIEINKIQSFVLGDDALIYDLEAAGFINITQMIEST